MFVEAENDRRRRKTRTWESEQIADGRSKPKDKAPPARGHKGGRKFALSKTQVQLA